MEHVNVMGMKLNNPVVVASGPWSRGITKMKQVLARNPGAVFTESIVSEVYPDPRPRYAWDKQSHGLQNIRIYSGIELETWIEDLTEINKQKRYGSTAKLIASVMGTTPSEARYIAKTVEKTGVDGIELGLACPMGEGPQVLAANPDMVYEFAKETVDAVNIPVGVKLGANTGDLTAVVKAAERAGVAGISGIDTMRCILNIAVETGKPALPTYGGYSGAPIKAMGLACVAGIVQSTSLPVLGIGGITNYQDMLEYIMVGANACGIGTEILLGGFDVIKSVKNELEEWMNQKGIHSLSEIRGVVLSNLRSFEEIDQNEKTAVISRLCNRPETDCSLCVSACLENAVDIVDGTIAIDRTVCDGCGLCASICPDGNITLEW